VHGAAVCDLDEALAILVVQRALHVDLATNAAEHPGLLFGLLAVLRVDPVVTEVDGRAVEGQALAVGVHPQGY
jgi:hypothetical protein